LPPAKEQIEIILGTTALTGKGCTRGLAPHGELALDLSAAAD
jgi:hypothetical protein